MRISKNRKNRRKGEVLLVVLVWLGVLAVYLGAGAQAIFRGLAASRQSSSRCGNSSFISSIREGNVEAVRCHLDAGSSAASRIESDPERSTVLMAASLAGRAEVVGLLLERGAEVGARCLRGRTALMWAAWEGHDEVIALLLDRAAKASAVSQLLDARDGDGRSALMFASMAGRREAAALLVRSGAGLNAADSNGFSALAYAVSAGRSDLVNDLLASGAAPEAARISPAALAVARKCYACLEALLARETEVKRGIKTGVKTGVKTEVRAGSNEEGSMSGALLWAVELGDHRALEMLSRRLQIKGVRGGRGETLLHRAVLAGDRLLSERLIELGAEVEARRESDGATPLLLSVSREQSDPSLVKLLVESGAEVDALDKDKESALLKAVRKRHLPAVRVLLAKGASPDVNDRFGQTPLMLAARAGEVEIIRELLSSGADASLGDANGQTALMAAIRAHQSAAFLALLAAGGGLQWSDRQGLTPLMIAAETGQAEIVGALVRAGAGLDLRDSYGLTAAERARRAGHHGIERMIGETR